jgi:hypothetical protein
VIAVVICCAQGQCRARRIRRRRLPRTRHPAAVDQERGRKTQQRLGWQERHLPATLNGAAREKRPELLARLADRQLQVTSEVSHAARLLPARSPGKPLARTRAPRRHVPTAAEADVAYGRHQRRLRDVAPVGHGRACLVRTPWRRAALATVERRGEELVLKDFYISFSAVCFTLLGLWLIVVQTRHAEWRGSALHRQRAYGVALHFSLPGLMSLLALVNPDSSVLWRTSFAIVAIGGAVVLIAVRGAATGKLGLTAYVFAIALYALIGILAIAPRIVSGLGLGASPVRVEAVLLTILVFAGVNVAWLLLFEEVPSEGAPHNQCTAAQQATLPHHPRGSQGNRAEERGHRSPPPA